MSNSAETMVIETTAGVVVKAYSGIVKMNEEIRLGQESAWAVMGVLRRQKPIVEDFEKRQLRLYKDAGFVVGINSGMQLEFAAKGQDETLEAFTERKAAHIKKIAELNDAFDELRDQPVSIECKPLTRGLFDDQPNTPDDRKMKFNPNWLVDAGPFLVD